MQKSQRKLLLLLGSITLLTSLSQSNPLNASNPRLSKLKKLLQVLEYSTHLEGDIDPDDKISLTTQVVDHVNGETYYITPVLDNIDGKFSYSHHISQENDADVYRVTANADAQVNSDNNLSLHVQNMKNNSEGALAGQYARYAEYLKHYIEYLYTNNISLDPTQMKNLQKEYTYYGSISNGNSPAVEASFQFENHKNNNQLEKRHSSVGGTQGPQETSISYGITNVPGTGPSHSIENTVASANGDNPVSGIQLSGRENSLGIEHGSLGQAVAELAKENTVTLVDSHGIVDGEGFTTNSSYSEDEQDVLATVGEVQNKAEFVRKDVNVGTGVKGMLVGNRGGGISIQKLLERDHVLKQQKFTENKNAMVGSSLSGTKVFFHFLWCSVYYIFFIKNYFLTEENEPLKFDYLSSSNSKFKSTKNEIEKASIPQLSLIQKPTQNLPDLLENIKSPSSTPGTLDLGNSASGNITIKAKKPKFGFPSFSEKPIQLKIEPSSIKKKTKSKLVLKPKQISMEDLIKIDQETGVRKFPTAGNTMNFPYISRYRFVFIIFKCVINIFIIFIKFLEIGNLVEAGINHFWETKQLPRIMPLLWILIGNFKFCI
jgi:hypothetical protein